MPDTAIAPRPRIAILLNAPGGGGISSMALKQARAFAARGYPVDLVVDTTAGKAYLGNLPAGIRAVDLGYRLRGGTLASLPLLLPLARYLRRDRPTLLLCHLTLVNGAAALAQRLAPATRVALVEHLPLPPSAGFAARLARRLRPWLYRQAGAIVAVSGDLARELSQQLHLPPAAVQVIYNPVVSKELETLAREHLDHPWFQPGTPPVVLGIGRLVAQKDFATLLRAVAMLHSTPAPRLAILGEGPQRPDLLALAAELGIADRVALLGYVDNPYAYLRRAAVFALSSRFEGLPTALIEALACGCQAVATDCPHGPREILADGRYGQLVPVGDAIALAAAIQTALNAPLDPVLLQERAQAFSVETSAANYLALAPP